MRIQRIIIENSRWCPSLSIDLRGHLVIVGPNEAGKSSLLRLLDAALSWTNGRLLNELTVAAVAAADRPLVVEVRLCDPDAEAEAAFADEIEVGSDGSLSLTVRLEARVSADDPLALDIQRDFVKDGVRPIRVLQKHLPYLRWTLLQANRSADRELGRGRSGTVRTLLDSVDLKGDRAALGAAVKALNDALASSGPLDELRGQIAAALSEVYPRSVDRSAVLVELPSAHDPLSDVDVRLVPVDGGEGASLLEQSDGLRSLSVMSLQMLVRGGAAITAVDEPEVHLHPRSQARVARLLASKPGQRVIATHAPAVVRAFKPSEVLALTGAGARQLSAGAIESDLKFFSQWWVEATLEPLTARGVILVEGISDETLLRTIAQLKEVDLDREGLSVVSLGGANNFTNAYRLFGRDGFGIPVAALVDEAEAGQPAEALGIDRADLERSGVFVATPDLEGEYCAALGASRTLDALTRSGLFTEAQILAATKGSDIRDIPEDDVWQFCRSKKRKTMAAIAISEALCVEDVDAIVTLSAVIEFACHS